MVAAMNPKGKDKGGADKPAQPTPGTAAAKKAALPVIPRKAHLASQIKFSAAAAAPLGPVRTAPLVPGNSLLLHGSSSSTDSGEVGGEERIIPGLEAVVVGKAQKKNLKRMQKKAAAEGGSTAGMDSSITGGGSSIAGGSTADGNGSSVADSAEWGAAERELLDRGAAAPVEMMGGRGFVRDLEAYSRLVAAYMGGDDSDDDDSGNSDDTQQHANVPAGFDGVMNMCSFDTVYGAHAYAPPPEAPTPAAPAPAARDAQAEAEAAAQAAEEERLLQAALAASAAEAEERARREAAEEAAALGMYRQQLQAQQQAQLQAQRQAQQQAQLQAQQQRNAVTAGGLYGLAAAPPALPFAVAAAPQQQEASLWVSAPPAPAHGYGLGPKAPFASEAPRVPPGYGSYYKQGAVAAEEGNPVDDDDDDLLDSVLALCGVGA